MNAASTPWLMPTRIDTMYKVTQQVVDLALLLRRDGYSGAITLTGGPEGSSGVDEYDSVGAAEVMKDGSCLRLAPVGEESIYLTQDDKTGLFVVVGRYDVLYRAKASDGHMPVWSIVNVLWELFNMYREDGYKMSLAWKDIFSAYGHSLNPQECLA